MPSDHALLSASGAHKWLHCTASARLEETFPETTSEFAEEGRLAHAFAELYLQKHFTVLKPSSYKRTLAILQADAKYNIEMLGHAQTYLDYVSSVSMGYPTKPHVSIEQRVDFSSFVPEGFGTADCILIGGKTIHVIDFKYGKGVPVGAENNPQMMLYALGALAAYEFLFPIEFVTLTIIQPRLDSLPSWTLPVEELRAWGESIKETAQAAFEGKGEPCPGEWCRFCRAKALCRARSEFAQEPFETVQGLKPPLITNADVGAILKRADVIKKWISDIEDYALTALLSGDEIPGWKAVEGRAVRAFSDPEAAFEKLIKTGTAESVLYERKPISLASVEELLGKKDFSELLGDYIVTPPGKPALAAESDKRPAIQRRSAADDFGGDTGGGEV